MESEYRESNEAENNRSGGAYFMKFLGVTSPVVRYLMP